MGCQTASFLQIRCYNRPPHAYFSCSNTLNPARFSQWILRVDSNQNARRIAYLGSSFIGTVTLSMFPRQLCFAFFRLAGILIPLCRLFYSVFARMMGVPSSFTSRLQCGSHFEGQLSPYLMCKTFAGRKDNVIKKHLSSCELPMY